MTAARRKAAHPTPPLAVGENWFVLLPGETRVSRTEVSEMSQSTIVLKAQPDCGRAPSELSGRYERGYVKFVERIYS